VTAEQRGFGNDHGLDPGVQAGKVKGSALPEKIGQNGGVTPEMPAKADEANKTGLQHIGGQWQKYTTDVNGPRQCQPSEEGNAPGTTFVGAKVPGAAPAGVAPVAPGPAPMLWEGVVPYLKSQDLAVARGGAQLASTIGTGVDLASKTFNQGVRQVIPGASNVINGQGNLQWGASPPEARFWNSKFAILQRREPLIC
jgi:hypothetical protein